MLCNAAQKVVHQRILTSRIHIEEDSRKTITRMPRVAPDKNRNMITFSQTIQQVQEIPVRKGEPVSEVIENQLPREL